MQISGSVAPGFEPVELLFAKNMASLNELDAQLCVYVDGQQVVDLWAGTSAGFTADSLVNILGRHFR